MLQKFHRGRARRLGALPPGRVIDARADHPALDHVLGIANLYAQVEVPGTIDQLVDVLREKYHRPVPAADLLMSDPYKELMPLVTDSKDLGSGVIYGIECDHLAFRTKEVDWQIWIAQGARPYPCRYVITSTKVTGWPQYTLDIWAWKTGTEVASDSFNLVIPAGAKQLMPDQVPELNGYVTPQGELRMQTPTGQTFVGQIDPYYVLRGHVAGNCVYDATWQRKGAGGLKPN